MMVTVTKDNVTRTFFTQSINDLDKRRKGTALVHKAEQPAGGNPSG
jgi:hypothetical protein